MKVLLIDDDINIVSSLKRIIEEEGQHQICGTYTSPIDALEDLEYWNPDVVIVDMLMPKMDGLGFIRRAKKILPELSFVTLSMVSSKDIIEKAYGLGVEYYIQKPLNKIETLTVLRKVTDSLSMRRAFQKMQTLFISEQAERGALQPAGAPPAYPTQMREARKILRNLGLLGDAGMKDILDSVEYMMQHPEEADSISLKELCNAISSNPRTCEQRLRRTVFNGMVNLAHMGLEDYGNEIFMEYASNLYNFEQVRKEMNCIRTDSGVHGNAKVKSFLTSLYSYVN